MGQDISHMLREWEFDPDSNVRKIRGDDGIQKVQVRIDQGAFQGILQLNMDGRPDGRKPHGFDFVLDYYCHSLEVHRKKHSGSENGFTLDQNDCKELFDEGVRVYGRYGFLLQLKDYERVIRDTERNMKLFRFVNDYALEEEDRSNLEKWWPYILRIHATARAKLAVQEKDYEQAFEIIDETKDKIAQLPQVEAEEFFIESERSQQALDELREELQNSRPLSREERLKQDLQEAIDQDAFEEAALIRDELKSLQDPDPGQSGVN